MRKILFLFALLMSISVMAQNRQQTLVLWMHNGQKVMFSLEDEPRITFEGSLICVKSESLNAEYQRSQVRRYTFEGASTAVADAKPSGMGFRQKGDELLMYGLPQNVNVQLFDPKGVMLDSKKVIADEYVTFSLEGKPKGVYIVKIGDQSIKFQKQ